MQNQERGGVILTQPRQVLLSAPVSVPPVSLPTPTGSERQIPCSQRFAASLALFALFFALPSFISNDLQTLLRKYRGVGGLATPDVQTSRRSDLETFRRSVWFKHAALRAGLPQRPASILSCRR